MLRLGDHPVRHAAGSQLLGGELHQLGCVCGPAAVLPEDRRKAFRREHAVYGVFQHPEAVGNRDRQRAAAAALSGDQSDHRHSQAAHEHDALGNGLALSVALRLQTGIGAGGVHKGDHRASELLCLPHQPHGLAIALRLRHAEVAADILLQGLALAVTDHCHRTVPQHGNAAHNGTIVHAGTVAPLLKEVGEQVVDIVLNIGPVLGTGQLHPLIGTALCISHFCAPPRCAAAADGSAPHAFHSGARPRPQSRIPAEIPPAGIPRAASA